MVALRASISACVSLGTATRIPPEDSAAVPKLHMHLYALYSTGAEAVMSNNTLLEEKLVDTFKGCSPTPTATAEKVEFTATVTGKKIERQSDLIKCDIAWTESSGTVTQEMVTHRTGAVGEEATSLVWVDQGDATMNRATFTFMKTRFANIPISSDEWKELIVSSSAGIEKSKIVIDKIQHTGIDFSKEVFHSDVFWWEKNGEQEKPIGRFHYDDVLLWSGEEVQINKTEVEFDVTEAATEMPTSDDGWEALIINMEGVNQTHVPIVKIIQKGLNVEKTKFQCDVYWVGNYGRGTAADIVPGVMLDETMMNRATFNFQRTQFAKIPNNDDEWKDLIVSSSAGILKSDIVIGKIRHVGIDSSREVFESDVFWWDKNNQEPKQTGRSNIDDDAPVYVDKVVRKTTFHFGVSEAAIRMPTTDDEWKALIKSREQVSGTHVTIVKIIQKGLNEKKTTFGCDVYWVWDAATENFMNEK